MKTATKLLAAVIALCLLSALAALGASAISKSELLETTYAFDQILFGEETFNNFTFVYFDKADNTIKDMVYLPIGESPWNPGLDMYTGPTEEGESEGYEYIILNYTYGCPTIHPSLMGQTGCAFTVPYTGTVNVLTYFRCGSVLPDASELFIYKNTVSAENLLMDQVGTEDGATAEYTVTVDVTAGDIIYWFVDCMDSTANDSCDFNPRVVYTEVNDENVSDEEPAGTTEETEENTEEDAEEDTGAGTTAAATEEKKATTAPAGDEPAVTTAAPAADDNGSPVLWIVIAAVVVIAAAVAGIVIAKKKKK